MPSPIGDRVTIGVTAVVMSGVVIEDGAMVSAGAVVPKDTRIGAVECGVAFRLENFCTAEVPKSRKSLGGSLPVRPLVLGAIKKKAGLRRPFFARKGNYKSSSIILVRRTAPAPRRAMRAQQCKCTGFRDGKVLVGVSLEGNCDISVGVPKLHVSAPTARRAIPAGYVIPEAEGSRFGVVPHRSGLI